jgi:threonine synthase
VIATPISPGRTGPETRDVTLFCASCDRVYVLLATRCACGGLIETRYEASDTLEGRSSGFFERFWPVLPLRDATGLPRDLDLSSPTIRADRLRAAIGGPELWLKDETALPTRSTKARVGILVFPFLRELGIREFVVSSTGNTSTAVAWMARYYPEMRVHIFIGQEFATRLDHVASPNVTTHVLAKSFVATSAAAQEFAARHRLFWEAGFFNPARRDGLKTAFIEAVLQMGRAPAGYVQAVSSAMGVVGTAKGAAELPAFGLPAAVPRLICVQQASCAPMVTAWEAGSATIRPEDTIADPQGIAEAILRGDPSGAYPIVRRLVRDSGGTFVKVGDAAIRRTQALLKEHAGIVACEAGACGLAGHIALVGRGELRENDGPILVNVTGGPRYR